MAEDAESQDGGAEAVDRAQDSRRRGVLRVTLTEPETVPMTDEQHRQAVKALSAMILDWLRKQRTPREQ